MRWMVIAACASVLVGCASSAIPLDKAVSAPAAEIFAFQANDSAHRSRITVMRDGGTIGSACDIAVFIDGVKSAHLGAGEKATFWVTPGVRNVSIGWSNVGICTSSLNALKTLSADARDEKEVVFRASVDMQGIYLNPYVKY